MVLTAWRRFGLGVGLGNGTRRFGLAVVGALLFAMRANANDSVDKYNFDFWDFGRNELPLRFVDLEQGSLCRRHAAHHPAKAWPAQGRGRGVCRYRCAAPQGHQDGALPGEPDRRSALQFSLAIKWGWRTDNPCRGIEFNHEDRRERFLSPEELSRLAGALDQCRDRQAAAVIALVLLTGSRIGEALSMRWQDVDLSNGVWTKPSAHTKQKKSHRLPLSEPARALLSKLRAEAHGADYMFPGIGRSGHRYEIKQAWKQVCAIANIKGARVHASILVSSGYSLPIIGKLLGHTQTATTARYAHLMDDPLRLATEKAGAIIISGHK